MVLQVRVTCSGSASAHLERPSNAEAAAVGAVCAFLYASFTVLPPDLVVGSMTGLAYRAQLVPQLWQYIKRCHQAHSWPPVELAGRNLGDLQLTGDLLGWMLPLAVFCPVYR
jgi:ubiquitin-protein ligase E3 C